MQRVALLFEFPTLNGGEHSMLTAIDHLSHEPLEFAALAPREGRLPEALHERGIHHLPITFHDESGQRLPRAEVSDEIRGALQKISPNILHANSLAMGRLTGALANHLPVPCIAHLRDILKLSRSSVEDLSQNRLLLAVSQATRDFHVRQGLPADRVRVLYNGVDGNRFRPRLRDGALRRELGLPAEAFLIATIGQIGLRKGHDILAESAVLVAGRLPNAHYLIVGERHSSKTESVQFERDFVERFRTAGLGGRLHLLGYRPDVPELMNAADLLVHPAHQEPLGRVLLEAAASGLPIVATAVGGTEEILCDGESARLVTAGDAKSLASAMIELHGDLSRRARLAAAARQRVLMAFGARQAAQELAAIWQELLG